MARKAREQSSMGVYHAILRGVNKQQIFECNEDCESGFCSLQPVLSRISQDELLALVEELLPKETERGLLDYDRVCKIGSLCDDDVWMLLEGLGGMRNAADFQSLPRPKQKHILYQAHQEGVGPRTLSRLTGVPYGIVQRAVAVERLDSTTDRVSEDDIIWELKCPDYVK